MEEFTKFQRDMVDLGVFCQMNMSDEYYVQIARRYAYQVMVRLSRKACFVLDALLESESERIRLEAAKAILRITMQELD